MNNAKIGPVVLNKSGCNRLEVRATPTKSMDHFKKDMTICFMLFTDPDEGVKIAATRVLLTIISQMITFGIVMDHQ